jgi:uncharacterized protein (TIGR02284 family)
MENNDKVISVLNGLIEICKDGEKGYRDAADAIQNGFYHVLFGDYARQRAAFASELQAVVRSLGGIPDRKGTMAGNLHRGWINLRLALESKKDDAIVLECERGESLALKNYQDALKIDLPPGIKIILEKQYAVIRATRQRVHVITHDPVIAIRK